MERPTSPGSDGEEHDKEHTIPGFISKLLAMINDPSIKHLISWTDKGDTFKVHNANHLAQEVLPKYYKHRNFTSLVRQLNMYGFHKVVGVDQGGLKGQSDQVWEFIHPYVHRDHPELLVHVRRKSEKSSSHHKDASASTSKGKGKSDVSNLVSELHSMRYEHSVIADKFLEMERQNRALWEEVDHLKKQNTEQQWKIHKILQFIAQLFNRETLPSAKRTRYLEDNTERANAVELPAELSDFQEFAEPLGTDARIAEVFADLPATSSASTSGAPAVPTSAASVAAVLALGEPLFPLPTVTLPTARAAASTAAAPAAASTDPASDNSSRILRYASLQDGLEKRLESTRPRLASAGLDQSTISALFNTSQEPISMNSSLHPFLGEALDLPDLLSDPATDFPSGSVDTGCQPQLPRGDPNAVSPSPRSKRTVPA